MKIVLTNDDGIDAPGLRMLQSCVRDLGKIIIAAPRDPQSGMAHKVTVHSPIRVDKIEKDRFSIHGTPADCSRLALKEIAPDADWLIAGINPGANLGSDVYNSGTVAAAREAAILGCRSIAVSQYVSRDNPIDWNATGFHSGTILRMLMGRQLSEGHFWNVNLPHPITEDTDLDYRYCGLDTHPHQYDYHLNGTEYTYDGSIHDRPRGPGTDVSVCFDESRVSITRIALGTTKFLNNSG